MSGKTYIVVENTTDEDVTVWLTLGATPGCVHDVQKIVLQDSLVMQGSGLVGNFVLPKHSHTQVLAPIENGVLPGFNGNFTFGTQPMNCPTPDWPEGTNLAEFIINNGFQEGYPQETVDISGVCGTNAFIEFELEMDDWTSNGGAIQVKNIKNSTRFNNTNIPGVYPYGCDNCTASVAPPECIGQHPEYANQEPICNVQRDARSNQGGRVTVRFNGFTPVPL